MLELEILARNQNCEWEGGIGDLVEWAAKEIVSLRAEIKAQDEIDLSELPLKPDCVWTHSQDCDFDTTCENAFTFNDGGLWQNGFKFCPYCGGKLLLDPLEGDGEEDA